VAPHFPRSSFGGRGRGANVHPLSASAPAWLR
jgi:hypothetical protein